MIASTISRTIPALALALTSLAALAAQPPPREWWILNAGDGLCERPHGGLLASPEAQRKALRSAGIAETTKVIKNQDGEMVSVAQSITGTGGTPVTVFWFPDQGKCESGRALAIDAELIPNTEDLK